MAQQQVAGRLKKAVLDKIEQRTARVGVVGLGYVGLPLAEILGRSGFRVTGFDVDASKVEAIRRGESYIDDVSTEHLKAQVDAGRMGATDDFDLLREMDVIVICVPTPLRKTLEPDISYVVSVAEEISGRIAPGQLIVLESTTYPGTTDEVVLPLLSKSGLQVGEHFFLAFSPERVDPANPEFKTENTPKVVGGCTESCAEVAASFYRSAIPEVHVVSSARAAEMVKLLENTFRLVNIGWINEFALISSKLGVNVWEVIEAAATKPFGFMPFYPGPGLGGHCIPVDPHYLSWKLRSLNYFTKFIDLASEINRSMPSHVVTRLGLLLNEQGKPLKGSRVLLIGVAYKKNTSDTRESPAIDIVQLARERGAVVSYHDPFVSSFDVDGEPVSQLPLTATTLSEQDAVVILADHSSIDYDALVRHSSLVFDTRNATSAAPGACENVFKL